MTTCETNTEKKPSYLNLACCVNGYSNLTTYDSKIRQDINKSREVSPIRPSTNSIQYCKRSNSLAPPVLLTMPNINPNNLNNSSDKRYTHYENNNTKRSEDAIFVDGYNPTQDERSGTSFIQQRVERLYGPGALAQGFYSPKKVLSPNSNRFNNPTTASTELTRKFQQLSPSNNFCEFQKKINSSVSNSVQNIVPSSSEHLDNNVVDLPVMRHLSQEFRAQLPAISPKKHYLRQLMDKDVDSVSINGSTKIPNKSPNEVLKEYVKDEVDKALYVNLNMNESKEHFNNQNINANNKEIIKSSNGDIALKSQDNKAANSVKLSVNTVKCYPLEKDGNHFLNILKTEQLRLLSMASDIEKMIEELSSNPDITEDTLGLLRSASGKARLLVSQKMKQFEGLCHNNLNRSPEDQFPTTLDDLQGFWDMVNLQIDHIDSIFSEIEILKNNDWKKPKQVSCTKIPTKQQKITKTGTTKGKFDNKMSGNDSKDVVKPMSEAALKRESQRKQLQEMKRKNRMALAAKSSMSAPDAKANSNTLNSNSIAIFLSDNLTHN